jgi:hypothetical protein
MAARRDPHVVGYLGQGRTGKSHLMDVHFRDWQRGNPNANVYNIGKRDPGSHWVRGADSKPDRRGEGGYKLLYPFIEELTNYGQGPFLPPYVNPRVGLSGAMVRAKDAEGFIPKHIVGTPWWSLVWECSHNRIDFQFDGHRPQAFDPELLAACHHLYLFAMPEKNAREYLESLESLKDSQVLVDDLFPTKKGQYIHVRQDPSREVDTEATYHDDYDPALDDNLRSLA